MPCATCAHDRDWAKTSTGPVPRLRGNPYPGTRRGMGYLEVVVGRRRLSLNPVLGWLTYGHTPAWNPVASGFSL